ncbi:hypothetical protein ABVY39_004853 [Vibrio parahaemolyticus]
MSWFEDLGNFGSGLLDDVGEGVGNLIQGATTAPKAPDKAANPAVHQQPKQTVVDTNGNAVTKGFGEKWIENKPVMIGGIGLAVLLVLVLLVLAVRK